MFVVLRTNFCDKYERQKKYNLATSLPFTNLVPDLSQSSANNRLVY